MDFSQIATEIWGNDVARFFSLAVGGVLALSFFGLRFAPLAGFARRGATLCTTLGVLGTFAGIFLGLLGFDVGQIDKSVPELLEGLKIAFFTSIFGMGAAVLLRIVEALIPPRPEAGGEATPEAIHRTLREIDATIARSTDEQAAVLAEIRNAISADSDSSLVTQTQKLRISVEDGNRQLIAEFKQFAETMAENNSRALIEALENVVRDFNTQLNEQFGENFKQLNQAVGALLEWQERYRSHVETMEERIEAAVAALQTSEAALSAIAGHAAQIPEALAQLRALLDGFTTAVETLRGTLDDHRAAAGELNAHLRAVADLKDRALEAFPTIEVNIRTLTEGFAAAQDAFRVSLDAVLTDIQTSANAMDQQHPENLRRFHDLVEQQFQTFDQQMQQELTRVLENMGRQLASLSEKFTTDYTPLTERLRGVLDMAERGTR